MRVTGSRGALRGKHGCCLGKGNKGQFLKRALKRHNFQLADSLRKRTAPRRHPPAFCLLVGAAGWGEREQGLLNDGGLLIGTWWPGALFSHAPPTQLPADSETGISSMEATVCLTPAPS